MAKHPTHHHHHKRKLAKPAGRGGTLMVTGTLVLALAAGGAAAWQAHLRPPTLPTPHLAWPVLPWWGYVCAIAIVAGLLALVARQLHHQHRARHPWSEIVMGIKTVDDIYALTPGQFEQFVGYLFQRAGFTAQVVGHSGDEGIDVELRKRGPQGEQRIVAQCKRYKGTVGQPIVREFYGSFAEHAVEGYLVTTGTFTHPAIDWAQSRPLRLVDGAELLRWTNEVARQLHSHGERAPHFAAMAS
jgi:HJR/Mrr/RecB family endonuclease